MAHDLRAQRIVIEIRPANHPEQENPRETFAGHAWETLWTPLQLAYFNGYAMWTYVNLPFVLVEPGIHMIEIPPITQDNATLKGLLRRFRSTFIRIARNRSVYFDADGLLRRRIMKSTSQAKSARRI